MTHDVFICHSSKDRTIANAICSTLEQNHIRCWIAPRDVVPGSDYAGSIIESISASKLAVLVFSSNSNGSVHVRREIERAVSHGIPVLPFRVEEVVPSLALEYFISDAHWLDAMTPPLEQHLEHLVGTVRLLLDRQAAAAAAVSTASPAEAAAALIAAAAAASALPMPPPAPVAAMPMPPPVPPGPGSVPATWSGPAHVETVRTAAPARGRPPTAVLAAIGAAAIVILAVGAYVLGGVGRPGPSLTAVLPSASPAMTAPLPSASATPVGTMGSTPSMIDVDTPAPQGSTAAPSAAIAQILAVLPKTVSCDPPKKPSAGSAEVFCYVGDGTTQYVDYTLYPNVADLRSDYGSWLAFYKLAAATSGACSKGEQVETVWSFSATPSVTEGHYFCVLDADKQAHLFWTDEASLILVDLGGEDGITLDKLYPIWRASTYDPVRH